MFYKSMTTYADLSTQTGIALPPLLSDLLASGKTVYGPDWAATWRQRYLQDPPLFMSWQDFEWIDAEASREIIEGWLHPGAQNGRSFLPFAQSGAGDAWCLTPLDTHGVGVALVLHDDEASSLSHACFDDFVCAGFLQAFADLSDQLDELSEPEALQLLQADVAQTTRFMTQELGGYLQDFCRRPLEIRPWRDGPRARVRQVASLISQDELAAELDRLPANAMSHLKKAQGALGDWHDCWQWLLQAEHQADLQPCVAIWHRTMANAEGQADRVLDKLSADCF